MNQMSTSFWASYIVTSRVLDSRGAKREGEFQSMKLREERGYRDWMMDTTQATLDSQLRMEYRQWLHSPGGDAWKEWKPSALMAFDALDTMYAEWNAAWEAGIERMFPRYNEKPYSPRRLPLTALRVALLGIVILACAWVALQSGLTAIWNLWPLITGGDFHRTFRWAGSGWSAFWMTWGFFAVSGLIGFMACIELVIHEDERKERIGGEVTNSKGPWATFQDHITPEDRMKELLDAIYTTAPVDHLPDLDLVVMPPPERAPEEVHALFAKWVELGVPTTGNYHHGYDELPEDS